MANEGRAAMQCRNGSWGTKTRNNIFINDKAASIEVDNSSIYQLDSSESVINDLTYTDIQNNLKKLAVNLPEGTKTISGITQEKVASEFVHSSNEPWVIIEGKWWRLNPNRPDFHPKPDSKLLTQWGDATALEDEGLSSHQRSTPFIGAYAPASH
jgi:hypothetical protein